MPVILNFLKHYLTTNSLLLLYFFFKKKEQEMGTYMSIEHAESAHEPVDPTVLSKNLSPKQRKLLRLGLVRPEECTQLPTEGIYHIIISEVLETGSSHPLIHGGSRAFAVTAVLDLGLRMLDSPRGREGIPPPLSPLS